MSLKATNIKAQGQRAEGERHPGYRCKYDTDPEGIEPGVRDGAKIYKIRVCWRLGHRHKSL
jgi:hypothetical protein